MTRTCDQCGKHLVTHRADARFCDEICKARWHNERRATDASTSIRIDGQNHGVGSRGGNVRDLDTARDLQAQQKEKRDWRDAIDEQIRRVLLETGYCHADDLDPLGVPPQHCNLKGTRLAWFRNQGFMEKTGVERKVAHKAANGRKAPIHRITPKGRRELTVGVSSGVPTPQGSSGCLIGPLRASADPGAQSAPEVDSEHREGSAAKSQNKPSGTLDRPVPFTSGESTGARSADDQGEGSGVTSHAPEPARQLQEGRDRQGRGVGSPSLGPKSKAAAADAAKRTADTQPARLPEAEPLSLLPEPDPEAWVA